MIYWMWQPFGWKYTAEVLQILQNWEAMFE